MRERHVADVLAIEREAFRNPWRREHFLFEIRDNPWAVNRIALLGRAIVGYSSVWRIRPELKINNVAVHHEWRGRGIGRWLLLTMIGDAVAAGCEIAQLEVRPSNTAALRLYHALGFSEVGRRPGYYEHDNEDAILMHLALSRSR